MSMDKKHKVARGCRLLAQVAGLAITFFGSFALVRSMGLPMWAFAGLVVAVGMFFCGWICPFGSVQEWLRAIGKSVAGLTLRIPENINRYLLLTRYIVLILGGTLALSVFDPRRTFLSLLAGRGAETMAYAALGAVLVLSLFMDRPFCKYLCVFGAIHGLSSVFRVFTIKRDVAKCANCQKCSRACSMDVEVAKARAVRDPHCIDCGRCLAACPVPGALASGLAFPCRADVRALKEKYFPAKDGAKKAA